jgi:hypothetical protein
MIFTAVSHRPRQNDTLGNTGAPIDFAIEESCGVRLLHTSALPRSKSFSFSCWHNLVQLKVPVAALHSAQNFI